MYEDTPAGLESPASTTDGGVSHDDETPAQTTDYDCDDDAEILQEDGILIADGGSDWTDLHAFQRDTLEAIYCLEADDETAYGLGIKEQLQDRYGEDLNHGRIYQNLDELVDRGLLAKRPLDKRTNEYVLTTAAEAMLEARAARLAEVCGVDVRETATDGGED
ncbi:PadR family transcriptional regulator [Haloarchaeobius sp. DFWS5]|uniref:PadR family transcriptional regulator n=1 Tax=Haloarchaeobius sp. DFWS5 TaxID=3446114 RepID=UPI003EB98F76